MLVGIDLTWVKPGKNGGTEFYIRNLLDGILELDSKIKFKLFVANDNYETFNHYCNDNRFSLVRCNLNANNLVQRVIWKNMFLYSKMKNEHIDLAFFPVYEMPLYKCKKFPTVAVIHDILAAHYPQYFSKIENVVYRLTWKRLVKNATEIVTISEFVKNDVNEILKREKDIRVINVPVEVDYVEEDFSATAKKYNIEKNNYYYTISSLLPHKNLKTLLKVFKRIKDENYQLPHKLLISGVGGKQQKELDSFITDNNLKDVIIFTGFISNEERNLLVQNTKCFLFSSIFEGFGMPPVEAMMLGANVLTTKEASIKEVTMDKCHYIDNPFDIDEWINKIEKIENSNSKREVFDKYDKKYLAQKYINCFEEIQEKGDL